MDVEGRRGTSRKIPWGFLGLLALIGVVETAIAGNGFAFASRLSFYWKNAGESATREAKGADILCFGDSLMKFGVNARVLERRLGRPSHNLGLVTGPTPGSYFLLKRALAAGARPSAILFDQKPSTFDVEPSWLIGEWPEVTSLSDCVEMATEARDARLLGALLVARALPSVRDRVQIRTNVVAALQGKTSTLSAEIPQAWRNWRVNGGSAMNPKNPWIAEDIAPEQAAEFYPPTLTRYPLNERYLRKFLDLAAAHQIPVFWVLPPVIPKLQEGRTARGLDEAFTRFVAQTQARYVNVTVLDARRSGYHHRVFFDVCHLDHQGATTLTIDIADAIARGGDGSRWVVLPNYRDRPAEPGVENVEQSRIALEALGKARR